MTKPAKEAEAVHALEIKCAAMETRSEDLSDRLARIESKLDRLLERGGAKQ